MSQQQVVSETSEINKTELSAQETHPTTIATESRDHPAELDKKPRRDSQASEKREPPRPEYIIVGKRPNTNYIYILKKLLKEDKFPEVHLTGRGDNGNSKVI